MPIRLNLLAEEQAAEELRRRDPVKRAIWIAALLASVLLLWAGWLEVRVFMAGRAVAKLEKEITERSEGFQQVLDLKKNASDVDYKLASLKELATNRFLNGTVLNALQQTTVDNVQLVRLRLEQTYLFVEGTKPKPAGDKGPRVLPKPPTWSEKIVLTLEGRDTSPNPEKSDAVNSFRSKIASHPYFQSALGKTNEVRLTNLSPPQPMPGGQLSVQFSLECRYPERVR